MVYLVWKLDVGNETPAELIGVWASADEARAQAVRWAEALSCGSGLVSESMMGDEWESKSRGGGYWRMSVQEVPFGPVGEK